MRNLQELFDAYLRTEPTAEKIKSATSMLIHIGKALNVPTQEEIDREYYTHIIASLDEYFAKTPAKARMDKAILAEMIGRVGLKPSLKPILEDLLTDQDENVRQFTLQVLEYHGIKKPATVMPILEKYRRSEDRIMITAAVYLAAKLACSEFSQTLFERMLRWYKGGSHHFVTDVLKRIVHLLEQGGCENKELTLEELKNWTEKNCPELKKVFLHR
jgi:hypothetical protein